MNSWQMNLIYKGARGFYNTSISKGANFIKGTEISMLNHTSHLDRSMPTDIRIITIRCNNQTRLKKHQVPIQSWKYSNKKCASTEERSGPEILV